VEALANIELKFESILGNEDWQRVNAKNLGHGLGIQIFPSSDYLPDKNAISYVGRFHFNVWEI
jgi:hypothetical protein